MLLTYLLLLTLLLLLEQGVNYQTNLLTARILLSKYPQGRVTDHRINLTLYKLDEVIQGDMQQVVEPLINEYQADQLAALGA